MRFKTPDLVNHEESCRARSRSAPLRVSLAALLFTGLSVCGSSAAPWPFEGDWDCELGRFRFSSTLYDPGDQPMQILDVAAEGETFTLTFEQDYQLSLAMNPDGSMTWYSPVSGDSFLCRPA